MNDDRAAADGASIESLEAALQTLAAEGGGSEAPLLSLEEALRELALLEAELGAPAVVAPSEVATVLIEPASQSEAAMLRATVPPKPEDFADLPPVLFRLDDEGSAKSPITIPPEADVKGDESVEVLKIEVALVPKIAEPEADPLEGLELDELG